MGIIIIPLGIMLFCQQYIIEGTDKSTSIQSMVAAILGMIPEGLFLLASTTLAISAMSLARNRVLVHDMKCIETLARADVLCVDKTGTITENTMQVTGVEPVSDMGEQELFSLLSDFAAEQSAVLHSVREHMFSAHRNFCYRQRVCRKFTVRYAIGVGAEFCCLDV